MIILAKRWFSCHGALLVLALCSVLAGGAHAQVHTVYRIDTRPPEEIFASGFVAQGLDNNLINHVFGWTRETAFVSTTASLDVAERLARLYLEQSSDPDALIYIYRMNANQDFYAAIPSLQSFLEQQRGAPMAARNEEREAQLELGIHEYGWEQEFVSVAPVPPSSIYWGRPMRRERDSRGIVRYRRGEFRRNAAWVQMPEESASTHDYPVTWPVEDEDQDSTATPTPAAEPEPSPSQPPPPSPPPPALSSCVDASWDVDEPVGVNCTGDLWAVMSDGEAVHMAMLPPCLAPLAVAHDVDVPICAKSWLRTNLSKLARVRAAFLSDDKEEPSAGKLEAARLLLSYDEL